MKEATGELNGTLMVVIAIAALSAIFFTVIWPMIRSDLKDSAKCSTAICDKGVDSDGMVYCRAPKNKKDEIHCPYRG